MPTRQKMLVLLFSTLMWNNLALSAVVTCTFDHATKLTKDGVWLNKITDYETLYELFGDGLIMPLKNDLLAKLDSKEIFHAATMPLGSVYLMGGEDGLVGKLTSVKGDIIDIYDGYCSVAFGKEVDAIKIDKSAEEALKESIKEALHEHRQELDSIPGMTQEMKDEIIEQTKREAREMYGADCCL